FMFAAFLVFLGSHDRAAANPASNWLSVPHAKLCVTEGTVEPGSGNRLSVNVPKMRAFVTIRTTQDVEAHFTYLGQTPGEKPLGSGEMRRQFGLKLRAQDPCNLVYAMWSIEPESKLVVSVKSNPGQHISAECGNRGYRNVKPVHSSPVPLLRPGAAHTLRAEMKGAEMRVYTDNNLVWEGNVGSEGGGFNGPVGMRSDNARLEIELRAGQSSATHPDYELPCRPGVGEVE
ncbi:MAG TPA: hypothetical protein VIX91_10930, partial [Candidatus Acidoferrum sp.]